MYWHLLYVRGAELLHSSEQRQLPSNDEVYHHVAAPSPFPAAPHHSRHPALLHLLKHGSTQDSKAQLMYSWTQVSDSHNVSSFSQHADAQLAASCAILGVLCYYAMYAGRASLIHVPDVEP
jgi:hypothetical protein